MKVTTIEKMYSDYLKMVGLNGKIGKTQNMEIKRAFFGACGQLLIMLRDEVGELDEDEAIKAMEGLKNQVGQFWDKEANKLN